MTRVLPNCLGFRVDPLVLHRNRRTLRRSKVSAVDVLRDNPRGVVADAPADRD